MVRLMICHFLPEYIIQMTANISYTGSNSYRQQKDQYDGILELFGENLSSNGTTQN